MTTHDRLDADAPQWRQLYELWKVFLIDQPAHVVDVFLDEGLETFDGFLTAFQDGVLAAVPQVEDGELWYLVAARTDGDPKALMRVHHSHTGLDPVTTELDRRVAETRGRVFVNGRRVNAGN